MIGGFICFFGGIAIFDNFALVALAGALGALIPVILVVRYVGSKSEAYQGAKVRYAKETARYKRTWYCYKCGSTFERASSAEFKAD